MAGLQRSVVSFRRQGSSGVVWDDKFISELNKAGQDNGESSAVAEVRTGRNIPPIKTIDPSAGRGFRSRDTVSPAVEPPSPRVSACGLCSAFGKSSGQKHRAPLAGRRRSR